MKFGNWVPISKGFLEHLPRDRPFTELEAAFSMQVDYDLDKPVTISGYSAEWRWNRKKVMAFFKKMGARISYPESTQKKQNQKGQIRGQIRDRSEVKNGQIRFIDSKGLETERDRSKEKKGQIRDRSRDTTKDPIINPNPKTPIYPDWLDLKSWEEFKCHRKEIKAPLTPLAEKKAIAKLRHLVDAGYDQAEIIDQTIANGWKGLFEVKRNAISQNIGDSRPQPIEITLENENSLYAN